MYMIPIITYYNTYYNVITYYYRRRGAIFRVGHEWLRHGRFGARNHAYTSETNRNARPAKMHWRTGDILNVCALPHIDDQQVPQCGSCHHCWTPPLVCQLLVFLQTMYWLTSSLVPLFWLWILNWYPGKTWEDTRNDDIHLLITTYYYALFYIWILHSVWILHSACPTWSCVFVELRMIHHNSSQINLGEAKS